MPIRIGSVNAISCLWKRKIVIAKVDGRTRQPIGACRSHKKGYFEPSLLLLMALQACSCMIKTIISLSILNYSFSMTNQVL